LKLSKALKDVSKEMKSELKALKDYLEEMKTELKALKGDSKQIHGDARYAT